MSHQRNQQWKRMLLSSWEPRQWFEYDGNPNSPEEQEPRTMWVYRQTDLRIWEVGYYDPNKRAIFEYTGEFKRELDAEEQQWIVEKTRYNPKVYEDDTFLDGSGDKIINEMIRLNQNPELKQLRVSGKQA
jgi:hypothetical protein